MRPLPQHVRPTAKHHLLAGAAMALLGRRRSKRATLRALLSYGIAHAMIVGPMRAFARRERRGEIGVDRKSLPSSLSAKQAVATALAIGAAQENGFGALPMVAGAALVAYDELATGSSPSDVAYGALLGAGIALSTRKIWPAPPRTTAERSFVVAEDERRFQRQARQTLGELGKEGEGLTVVVNGAAGTAKATADLIHDNLPKATVFEVNDAASFPAVLGAAARDATTLGIAGGDGSINAAASLAHQLGLPLVVFPAGTLNHFARDLRIESSEEAVNAVTEGDLAAVDVATIDGKVFLNTASFGAYVAFVHARKRLEDRIGKWPAMLVALFQVLRNAEPIEVELDGRRKKIWMIFIGNCKYEPQGFGPSWRRRLDDGLLDVRLVDGTQPWSRTRLLASVLAGSLGKSRVYEQRLVRELQVHSNSGPLTLARDGETFEGSESFSIVKSERTLAVYVPPEEPK